MARLSLSSTVKLASGFDMPIVGLGVYQNFDCTSACVAALKHGYKMIDTAEMYRNEEDVGKALKSSGINREEIFITTKVIQNSFGFEQSQKVVEESLRKLGVSYIDLDMLHSALGGKERRLEAYKALLLKQKEGKIRTVGVSNFGVKHLEELKEAGLATPAVNQIELHPLCQQKPIVDYCKKNNIVVQAYCPLIRGDFSNEALKKICKKTGKNPAQVLVRWSIQRGFIPLPKSGNPERVVTNVDVFDFELSDEDMTELDSEDKGDSGAISWNPVHCD